MDILVLLDQPYEGVPKYFVRIAYYFKTAHVSEKDMGVVCWEKKRKSKLYSPKL